MGSNEYVDMTGETYHKLTVLGRAPRGPLDHGSTRWLCQCECGAICIVRRDKLLGGQKSCGCIKREVKPKEPKLPKEPKPRGRPAKPKAESTEPKPIQPRKPPEEKVTHPRPFSVPDPKAGRAYGFTQTARCVHCKKVFERPAGPWGWMVGRDVCCTYKCMRAEERDRYPKLEGENKNA